MEGTVVHVKLENHSPTLSGSTLSDIGTLFGTPSTERGETVRGTYTQPLSPPSLSSVADSAEAGRGVGGRGTGLGSPVSERQGANRKRNASLAGFDSSPGTIESPEGDGSEDGQQLDDRRKQPVKRACNECRQQKVSHDSTGEEPAVL